MSNGKLNLIQEGKGLIGEGLLEIFSITGQRLKYQMIGPDEPVISIDIAALRKGIYVVVISGADGKRAAGRFVVQPM
ncbi:MAG: T9SS type A sorting domain-containing protein [Bacteroidales bacterium]|nr:T9SS type A sorting domain-containing protein [Bacteroidales bacterium]